MLADCNLPKAALSGEKTLKASDFEFNLSKPSYMWNTLQKLGPRCQRRRGLEHTLQGTCTALQDVVRSVSAVGSAGWRLWPLCDRPPVRSGERDGTRPGNITLSVLKMAVTRMFCC